MRQTIEKHSGIKKYRDKWTRCLEHGKYKQYSNKMVSPLCQRCSRFWSNSKRIGKHHMRLLLNDPVIE